MASHRETAEPEPSDLEQSDFESLVSLLHDLDPDTRIEIEVETPVTVPSAPPSQYYDHAHRRSESLTSDFLDLHRDDNLVKRKGSRRGDIMGQGISVEEATQDVKRMLDGEKAVVQAANSLRHLRGDQSLSPELTARVNLALNNVSYYQKWLVHIHSQPTSSTGVQTKNEAYNGLADRRKHEVIEGLKTQIAQHRALLYTDSGRLRTEGTENGQHDLADTLVTIDILETRLQELIGPTDEALWDSWAELQRLAAPRTPVNPEDPMDKPDPRVFDEWKQRRDHVAANPPDEKDFLKDVTPGELTVIYYNQSGSPESVHHVRGDIISERSPLLAAAFEEARSGTLLHLESVTSATIWPFLRFLYTGSYAMSHVDSDIFEEVPTSLLTHCRMFRLGDLYDLPDLRTQSYVNVLQQCEFGCSSADKPLELCDAIRFVYEHLRPHKDLLDTIINYCVTCFSSHGLQTDKEFCEMAYVLRPFHQDLCKNAMDRRFAGEEVEAVAAIVQMPFQQFQPATYASRQDSKVSTFRCDDVVHHFHSNEEDDFDDANRKRKRAEEVLRKRPVAPLSASDPRKSELTLMLRRNAESDQPDYHDDSSESSWEAVSMPLRKRRASTADGSAAPASVSASESDGYEVVDAAPSVQEAVETSSVDSDSDASTVLMRPTRTERPQLDGGKHSSLPLRPRVSEITQKEEAERREDCSGDSDWSILSN